LLYSISNNAQGKRLYFGDFLKSCRHACKLTQDELVYELYVHNSDYFEHLESTTISKWEKNSPIPRLSRQVSILTYFQKKMDMALPFFNTMKVEEVEKILSLSDMENLLGNSRQVVLNFPKFNKTVQELDIFHLRDLPSTEKILHLNEKLENDFNYALSEVRKEQVEAWSHSPDNIFLACMLEESFLGYLFTLRLKPEIFTKLVNLEMKESEIEEEHFASRNEMGSDYFLSFFAMNKQAAALLFIKYYAQLIVHQTNIQEVGGATMLDDAKKLIEKMCISRHKKKHMMVNDKDEIILQTYRETLSRFIACEGLVKMLFHHETQ